MPTTTARPRVQAVRAAISLCWPPAPALQFLPARAPSLVLVLNFSCARIAETWAHRFGIIPPPAAQQQTQSPRQVCVGASVWAFFLARLHWRHLSWPATHTRSLKCGLTRRTAPMVFELSRRIARHAKWDEKNARVSLHARARMHTGRWRSSETK